MNARDVLERFKRGEIGLDRAEQLLKLDFLEVIGDHTIFDHAREARRGIPEIIFGETKSPQVVADIVSRVLSDRDVILVSRASKEHLEAVKAVVDGHHVRYEERARMIVVDKQKDRKKQGMVGILTAGQLGHRRLPRRPRPWPRRWVARSSHPMTWGWPLCTGSWAR